jgi:hypothetical protein
MFPHCSIHKYTLASPDRKTHSQINHVLISNRQQSHIVDVPSFGGANCDSDHYLVVAKVRLSESKQAGKKFYMERFNLEKLNNVEVKEHYQIKISNRFAALE